MEALRLILAQKNWNDSLSLDVRKKIDLLLEVEKK
jgi:hypothetical protein